MNGNLDITFYDVDHGSAVWISTPSGYNVMYDLGRSAQFSPLVDVYNHGVRAFDAVVVSHPHLDHFNDIASLGYFSVWKLFRCDDALLLNAYRGQFRYRSDDVSFLQAQYSAWHHRCQYEMGIDGVNTGSYDTPDGVRLEIFAPNGCVDVNDQSIVVVVAYGDFRCVLTGDNGPASLSQLMSNSRFRNWASGVDVLLCPHHGRASGFDAGFVQLVNPVCCVASDRSGTDSAIGDYDRYCEGVWLVRHDTRQRFFGKVLTTRNNGHVWLSVAPMGACDVYVERG